MSGLSGQINVDGRLELELRHEGWVFIGALEIKSYF